MHKLAVSIIICRKNRSLPVDKVVQMSAGAVNHGFCYENQGWDEIYSLFGEIQIKFIG